MKKAQIIVDADNSALVMTKAFYKKACVFGSTEYYALRKAQAENEGFGVEFQYRVSGKETYTGLKFKRMAEYIQTQPDAEARMLEFEAVKKIAKAKGAMYPLTKKWFFATYPQFKEDEIGDSEKTKAVSDEKAMAEANTKAEAKAKAEAEKKIASIINSQNSDEELDSAVGF